MIFEPRTPFMCIYCGSRDEYPPEKRKPFGLPGYGESLAGRIVKCLNCDSFQFFDFDQQRMRKPTREEWAEWKDGEKLKDALAKQGD